MSPVSRILQHQVRSRARLRCEYCRMSQRLIGMPLVIDHIYPLSLGGSDDSDNLCAAFYRCNEFKGAQIQGKDPESGQLVSLFNPRIQDWHDHFRWANGGIHIVGITSIGRATVLALRLNNDYVVESRAHWIAFGWHPPEE